MYCPNCGNEQKFDGAVKCAECDMPLERVAEQVARHKGETKEETAAKEAASALTKQRLIGAAAFLAIASVPIGFGIKNSIQRER